MSCLAEPDDGNPSRRRGRAERPCERDEAGTFHFLFAAGADQRPAGRLWAQIDRWINEGGAGREEPPARQGEPR